MARTTTESLTVDYKKLKSMPPAIRNQLAEQNPSFLASLTPSQYNELFPRSGRLLSALSGGTPVQEPTTTGAPSGAPGTPPSGSKVASTAPVTKPSTKPQPSPDVRFGWEKRLEELAKKSGGGQNQQQTQTNINTYKPISGGIDRSSKLNELKDPETRKLFATMLLAEVGGQSTQDQQAFAEKVFNRAMVENRSLKNILSDRRYFEPYQNGTFNKAAATIAKNPDLLNKHLDTIDRVGYTGVDSIRGATHNASGKTAASVRRGGYDSVQSTIVQPGTETYYSKTWEQDKIKNLPRYGNVSEQSVLPGVTPEDVTKTGPKGVANEEELRLIGKSVRGIAFDSSLRGGGECVRGSQGVLGALLGDNKTFSRQIGDKAAGSMTIAGGNNYLNSTGYFNAAQTLPSDYLKDRSQWRIGDTIVAQGGGRGLGHIQVWNGKQWVSDHKQSGVYVGNYSGHTLYRLNDQALQRLNPKYIENMDGTGGTKSYMEINKLVPGSSQTVGTDKQANPTSTQQTFITKPEGYENIPEHIRKEIDALPESRRNDVYKNLHALKEKGIDYVDTLGKIYEQEKNNPTATIATIENTPPGELPKLAAETGDYSFWQEGSVPTAQERQKVFSEGGVVVNLDTNHAPRGRQTGPLVVIPDNATKEQREAAQQYVQQIEQAYKEQFGQSLPGRVVTRSQNGRGRTATIHTEPYSVNDEKAVEYFNRTPEGRAKIAAITSSTLGTIPKVKFSLPHNPYQQNPDYGASGPDGKWNEVGIARTALEDLKSRQASVVASKTQTAPPAPPAPVAEPPVKVAAAAPPQAPTTPTAATPTAVPEPPVTNTSYTAPTATPAEAAPAAEPAPTAAPLTDESGQIIPQLESGGEIRTGNEQVSILPGATSPQENATVMGSNGPIAEVNTSKENFNYNPQTGIIDVVPNNRTNPAELQQTQDMINNKEIQQADTQAEQQTATRSAPPPAPYTDTQNPNWMGLMYGIINSSANIYTNDSMQRAFNAVNFKSSGDPRINHFSWSNTNTV
jgi:hypothetical protein